MSRRHQPSFTRDPEDGLWFNEFYGWVTWEEKRQIRRQSMSPSDFDIYREEARLERNKQTGDN